MSMENQCDRPIVDARRVAVTLRELSFDLLRAMEAAVPIALAQAAGDLAPELRARIANHVFAETKARYAVLAAATLLTTDAGDGD